MLKHFLNSLPWLCISSSGHTLSHWATRLGGYTCWVIKVSPEIWLGLAFGPSRFESCHVSHQCEELRRWFAIPSLSEWPRSLHQDLNPSRPWGMGGAPAYSHSRVARIQRLDLMKVSTCVWLAPASVREKWISLLHSSSFEENKFNLWGNLNSLQTQSIPRLCPETTKTIPSNPETSFKQFKQFFVSTFHVSGLTWKKIEEEEEKTQNLGHAKSECFIFCF